MNREEVSIESILEGLVQQNLGGYNLGEDTVSELYAKVVSVNGQFEGTTASDWATISYVQTDSAYGHGGMPEWVAHEAEQVLDALCDAQIIKKRAVWFDKLGINRCREWPAIATLNCLAAPVICIPPTRTIEYSRFQVPDTWDLATYSIITKVENLLRSCSVCGPKCPLEYDSRLLNVAAALRAWPTIEAIMASSSRGAFISFAAMDRIQYTIAWYQVLFHIALDLAHYGAELYPMSIKWYGKALFQPCSHCLVLIRECNSQDEEQLNWQAVRETLISLLQQANRFCLPKALGAEGMYVWSLDGLESSPGEACMKGFSNHKRLFRILRRTVISQSKYDLIAANVVRGFPAMLSCHRHGDKWLCSLVLSNLKKIVAAFRSEREDFEDSFKLRTFELLKSERPFGQVSFDDFSMFTGEGWSSRSPVCNSREGQLCFFNELSGVIDPSSVGEFLADRGFSRRERAEILTSTEQLFRRRIHLNGVSFLCSELKNAATRPPAAGRCADCSKEAARFSMRNMILVGWRAKEGLLSSAVSGKERREDEPFYSFVTFDIEDSYSCHLLSRGNFSQSSATRCQNCRAMFARVTVENSHDLLEIHLRQKLPVARALTMVFKAISKCHQV